MSDRKMRTFQISVPVQVRSFELDEAGGITDVRDEEPSQVVFEVEAYTRAAAVQQVHRKLGT